MDIKIIQDPITKKELREMAKAWYGDLVKAVVDIEHGTMALPGEMHVDEEQVLLLQGSRQENLWGINLHPDEDEEHFIEFDSMINIRPRQNNRSRSVEDPATREKIKQIVELLIK